MRYAGLGAGLTAYTVSKIARERAPVLVVVPDTQRAERLTSDLRFFCCEQQVVSFLCWEVLPFDPLSPSGTISATRLYALHQLQVGQPIVVTTADALMQRILPAKYLEQAVYPLGKGQELRRDDLLRVLDAGGYQRSSLVEECGQMAIRGSIVDFFPPGSDHPVRLEWFGDSLESIRRFESASQRSVDELPHFDIIPVREVLVGGGEREPNARQLAIESAVQRVKERASALAIPQSKIAPIEDALRTGQYWPGLEHIQPLLGEQSATLWDYLPEKAAVVICDQRAVFDAADDHGVIVDERASRAEEEGRLFPKPEDAFLSSSEVTELLKQRMTHSFDPVQLLTAEDLQRTSKEKQKPKKQGYLSNEVLTSRLHLQRRREQPFKPLADFIREMNDKRLQVAISVSQPQRRTRMFELLEGYYVRPSETELDFAAWRESLKHKPEPGTWLIDGALSAGFQAPDEGFVVISDAELFPEIKPRRVASSVAQVRRFVGSLAQLQENDFIVHMDYGVGLYLGLCQKTVEGKVGDFLELEYAEGAKLFLPVEQIGRVQKYAGAEGKVPALTKLGGKTWEKTKAKVKKRVEELAGQLLSTIAQRELGDGFSFGPLDTDDARFADQFEFEETPDQSAAIEAVFADMALERPMDRLVCGDVGYGKTEVALRAAYKAANAGKQVALLVPTTVLARQHFLTFEERFADTAVTVACVSRFYSSVENKETLKKLEEGKIDVIIGTHRLLQKDVRFKDLGLVVLDEEHRFGVAHKEKLKRLRATVDMLTLSATPIPRTLHMSLVGIRDLSLIETAPSNRQVIRTYLARYEDSVVREAILRELGRNGQVFYIYNRVQSIAVVAEQLSELVPEARIEFAHGQMKRAELENVMHRFVNGEIDVLISTTIVESGLDISNANTMIIRNAERFGLAELYQLRGRVGRSNRRAYAYLLISDPTRLGKDARKRLEVLQSLDDLGVGFRLALQDMEIRGAGNLLGSDQSGHINLIGYELYSRILRDAVEELRKRQSNEIDREGEEPLPEVDPEIKIGFPVHIPPVFIPDVGERLLLYQRLIDVEHESEVIMLADEIRDRFGQYPDEVAVLLELMAFRALVKRHGIVEVKRVADSVQLSFHSEVEVDGKRLFEMITESELLRRITPGNGVVLHFHDREIDSPTTIQELVSNFLKELGFFRH